MEAYRCPHNPIISSGDIAPSQKDFEVIGVFNAGVTRLADEVILLMRVAEKPVSRHPEIIHAAVYDLEKQRIVFKDFFTDDPTNDLSDSRLITTPEGTYLTSISHLRLARGADVGMALRQRPGFGRARFQRSE
jgi:predicted GH43/DUF377 family glycosyl hydrolase